MTLKSLIETLEKHPKEKVLAIGFKTPHSYRGYYERLAFQPCRNITVGEMLSEAVSALGATYCGWKGGEFEMDENSDCYLAEIGRSGEEIGPILLELMLNTAAEEPACGPVSSGTPCTFKENPDRVEPL